MAGATDSSLKSQIQQEISSNKIMFYSKSYCHFCINAKDILKKHVPSGYQTKELDLIADGNDIQDALEKLTNQRTVPNIFIGGKHIGGCSDLERLNASGELAKLIAKL